MRSRAHKDAQKHFASSDRRDSNKTRTNASKRMILTVDGKNFAPPGTPPRVPRTRAWRTTTSRLRPPNLILEEPSATAGSFWIKPGGPEQKNRRRRPRPLVTSTLNQGMAKGSEVNEKVRQTNGDARPRRSGNRLEAVQSFVHQQSRKTSVG